MSADDALIAQELRPTYGSANYAEALAAVDRELAVAEARVARAPRQWIGYEGLAMGHLIKAQLTGSSEELLSASQQIAKGMQFAPELGGPVLAASTINLSLHRYPAARGYLDKYERFVVKRGPAEESAALGQSGEVAFYTGDYKTARVQFDKAHALDPNASTLFQLATWEKYLGDFDKAIGHYRQGALQGRSRSPELLSAYHLQIGALELQRGNWDLARDYFERANKLFPGHWLTEAHLAQMYAVDGDRAKAKAMYQQIIRRTNNPDVMMALASVLDFEGDARQADALRSAAQGIFDQRLKVLPEAYFDHALDLALATGKNARALELAEANYRARAFGDAGIALARAQLATGNPRAAIRQLLQVERSGWKSVEQDLTLSDAYAALGDDANSAKFRRQALKRNPKALAPERVMLAFGNH
jgi:tetratricopeptide (TPR) repeat protein